MSELDRTFNRLKMMESYTPDVHDLRLQDFIMRRITGVLNHEDMNITLQNIMLNQRLKITYDQIKDIYAI